MTTKIVQKHLVKGTREFEIIGDEVAYKIQSPIRTETLSVVLCVLDSEPVISGSMLSFVSQVNREPMVELFLDKPDKETFDQFVGTMQKRISEEDFGRLRVRGKGVKVDVQRVSESIEMLQTYLNRDEVESLLSALTALRAKPDDVKCLADVADAFNELGFVQGQVLTYAPYVNFMLAGDSERDSQ